MGAAALDILLDYLRPCTHFSVDLVAGSSLSRRAVATLDGYSTYD